MDEERAGRIIDGRVPSITAEERERAAGGVTNLRSLLSSIPPSDKEIVEDVNQGIADSAARAALKRSEARKDAILAVALAIKRRGQNPMIDWNTKDTDTAYAIGDLLDALGE